MELTGLMPQQKDIVTTLDRPLFVAAGAGSGKTFTLTQRILWALSEESGPYIEHVDQVLAITFTNAAAAEIRERVRTTLIAAGMDGEARAVDDAWISTIHGMCSRILKRHALELGIDPEFNVLEGESRVDRYRDLAVDHVLARARAGMDAHGRPLAHGYDELFGWYRPVAPTAGGHESTTTVRALVRRLLVLASAAPHGFDDVWLMRGKIDFHGLADAYRGCLSCKKTSAAYDVAVRALEAIRTFEASPRTRADLGACMLACEIPHSSKVFPKEEVELLRAEAADAFINAYAAVDAAAAEQLLELARAVFDEYEALKARDSLLDNNDLLRRAYQALRDHESIRAEYADRFKLVMIDEFQDTDQQQVDLIRFLTGKDGRTLCTVGDAQQSIYRFRGAEVEVFRRQQRALEASAALGADSAAGAPAGRVVQLTRNFRSHAEILACVARLFDGAQGGLMQDFLNLEPHEERHDGLVATGASRRQAVFVVGNHVEERRAAKAAAIAERFRALVDAGQPVGDMVLLLGGMAQADVYAAAIRAQGLNCVIAGGSVFAQAAEVQAMRALACALANPADTAQGLAPLLQSPMFALGAQEFLALTTAVDAQTGEVRRRNLDAGILANEDAPGFGALPLLDRARAVLQRAFSRMGRDSFAQVARDVVNESGWFVRLAARGPEGRAVAANILKALDALAEIEEDVGRAPRAIALGFDDFLAGREAPGALNEGDAGAVRIMTVHSSKGLEFPVVAVAECFAVPEDRTRVQMRRRPDGIVEVAALPARFTSVQGEDGKFVSGKEFEDRFKKYLGGSAAWLSPALADEVCASDSLAGSWLALREEEKRLELEERSRLLYVACTRAREALILALDAGVSYGKLSIDESRDLTGRVLGQLLPKAGQGGGFHPDADRLAFDGAQPGDYELLALCDFSHEGTSYGATVEIAEDGLHRLSESGAAGQDTEGVEEPDALLAAGADACAAAGISACPAPAHASDTFTLAYPEEVRYHTGVATPPVRDSYSYTSLAAALHAEGEDRAMASARVREEDDEDGSLRIARPVEGDPTALGSAFHAAAQWMLEMGEDVVPAARMDALARFWGCSPAQRARLEAALVRWCGSRIRREALGWPVVRAEVPFFSMGASEFAERFGAYAEGAIDLLCTDPARPAEALLIDYKTGGSPDETPEQLQEKHALQARVYADVLHKAGFERVHVRFVRVEIGDPASPGEPQQVRYEL